MTIEIYWDDLTTEKQQELLNARAKELVKAASYSCPLFPKGL